MSAMAHITLNDDAPGIIGLLHYRPQTARPLCELADVLLRGPSKLTRGERELIAAYVSARNECRFCAHSHAAFAAAQLPEGTALAETVSIAGDVTAVSPKLRALLAIANAVREGGRSVGEREIAAARAEHASDEEIHDTVLIAAAFCMYNRYVDGLATIAPDDPAAYADMADRIVSGGYLAAVDQSA
jgi:uncharacterized peroxidase-related enzyme